MGCTLDDYFADLDGASPESISGFFARKITTGELVQGERLPTVRQTAEALGVSPATVSHAWQALARSGLIVSRGRAGSFVQQTHQKWLPPRSLTLAGQMEDPGLDLSRGSPDPLLLPSTSAVFARVTERNDIVNYHEAPVLPELKQLLMSQWPYRVESLTIVDGALDAVVRSLQAVVRFGDRVIVENPGFPQFFDLLETMGAQAVPVRLDSEGILPEDLAQALRSKPTALVLQTRAHNPTGASMSQERAHELARIIKASPQADHLIVIEDDHSGGIATAPDISLGTWLPDQVLHALSFSKSHGPDLRLAALAGPARLIDRIVARRMLGPGWTSRMLQRIVYEMLIDETVGRQINHAKEVYAQRQQALRSALIRHGVSVAKAEGINMWLPVSNERQALIRLAANGIRVATGEPFLAEPGENFIRVTVGMVRQDAADIARMLADSARQGAD